MKKRLLSIALCLCMVLSLLPTAALAASDDEVVLNLGDICTSEYASVLITADATSYKVERFKTADDHPTSAPVALNGKTLVLTGTPKTECALDVPSTAKGSTVILRDLVISNKNYEALRVEGDVTISVEGGVSLSSGVQSITVSDGKTLAFIGKDDFTVASTKAGAPAISGGSGSALTADCTGNISVSAKAPAVSGFSGISLHTTGDLTLKNTGYASSTVSTTATGSENPGDNSIALAGRNITVETTTGTAASLLATAGVSMVATGDVLLKNNYANNRTPLCPESTELDVTAHGTYTRMVAEGSYVTQNGVTKIYPSGGVDLSALDAEAQYVVGDGTLDFVPGDATTDPVTPATVTLDNATLSTTKNALTLPTGAVNLILKGDSSLSGNYGISARSSDLTVTAENGATLEIFGQSYGIDANSITVKSGDLNLSSIDNACLAATNITLTGGTVTATTPESSMIGSVSGNQLVMENDASLISNATVFTEAAKVSDTAALRCSLLISSAPTITSDHVDALICATTTVNGQQAILDAHGDAVLNNYLEYMLPMLAAMETPVPVTLSVPEGATLTVPAGRNLFLPTLTSLKDVTPGSLYNNGEISLPASLVPKLDDLTALDIQGSGPVTLLDESGTTLKSYIKLDGTYCNYGGTPYFETADEQYAGTTTYFNSYSVSGHVIFTPGTGDQADQVKLHAMQIPGNEEDFYVGLRKNTEITLVGVNTLVTDETLFGYGGDNNDEDGDDDLAPITLTLKGSSSLYLEQNSADGGYAVYLQPGSLAVGETAQVTAGSPLYLSGGVTVGPQASFTGLVVTEQTESDDMFWDVCTVYGNAVIPVGQTVYATADLTFTQGATLTVNGMLCLPTGTTKADIEALRLSGNGLVAVDVVDGGTRIFRCDGTELNAPKEIDCSGETEGDLTEDGYHWDAATGILSLNNVYTGQIILPQGDGPVTLTIDSTGDCFLNDTMELSGSYPCDITFTGSGSMTISGEISQSGNDGDRVTVAEGAALTVLDTISLGASGYANGFLTVNGDLTVLPNGYDSAIACSNVSIGATGHLTVHGNEGVVVVGSAGKTSFTMEDGGMFTGDCTKFNVMALAGTTQPTADNMAQFFSLPDCYLPTDWVLRSVVDRTANPVKYVAVLAPRDANLSFSDENVSGAGGSVVLTAHTTVTFDANGQGTAPAPVSVIIGSKLTAPTAPTAAGYTFGGWYRDAACTTAWDFNTDTVTDGITLYAKWTEVSGGCSGGSGSISRTLTFVTNGGSTISSVSKSSGTTVDLSVYRPTRAGYTFAGWYSDAALTTAISSVKLTKSMTVYAKWTEVATVANLPFTDVPANAWYYDELLYAYNNGLFAGTSATTFDPQAPMTRQQMWMVLARMAGETPASMDAARTWAMENKISDGSNPKNNVTREQFVTLLWRFAGSPASDGAMGLAGYDDAAAIADYAREAMLWAVKNQIVSGTSTATLSPKASATRAQVAVILARYKQK